MKTETAKKCPLWVEWLAMAAWIGVVAGTLEGIVHVISRGFPLVRAAHKVSNEILYVAALVDTGALLVAGIVLLPVVWVMKQERMALPAAGLAFFGAYIVVSSPEVVQRYGMLSFSFGCAFLFYKKASQDTAFPARLCKRAWLIPLLVLVLYAGVHFLAFAQEKMGASALPSAAAGARNSLVIVLDTVRADRFGALLREGKLPNMAGLARRGASYSNAWATSSWSLPSHGTLLTGRLPQEHKIDWPAAKRDPAYPSLAEFYAQNGYASGAFSGNAAWVTPEYMGAGFLRFRAYVLEDLLRRTKVGKKVEATIEGRGWHSAGRGKKAPQVAGEFLDFVDDYSPRPFFAYLCFMDVNQAFHNRRMNLHGSLTEVLQDYDQELQRVDGVVGVLLEGLVRRGQLENTDIVLTSDHGESFGNANAGDHTPDGHQSSLYAEQQAVPLIVFSPGQVVPASIRSVVSLQQVAQTLMRLQGWKGAPFVGESLPLREGETETGSPCAFADLREHVTKAADSVTYKDWRLLRHFPNHLELKVGEELYEVAADPKEQKNRFADPAAAAVLAALRAQAEEFVQQGSQARCRDLPTALAHPPESSKNGPRIKQQ